MALTRDQQVKIIQAAKVKNPNLTLEQSKSLLNRANELSQPQVVAEPEKQGFGSKVFNGAMDFLNIPSSIAGGILESGTQVREGTYQPPSFPGGKFIAPPIVGAMRGFKDKTDVLTELPTFLGIDPESPAGMGVGFAGELVTPDPLDAVAGFKALRKAEKTGELQKVAPFAKNYLPDVVKEAEKIGVDLPTSAKTSNEFIKQTEALLQKSLFGGGIKNKVTKAFDDIATHYDEITSRFVKEQDLDSIGKIIKDDLDKFADGFQTRKRALYENVPDTVKNIEVNPENTLKALNETISRKSQSLLDNSFNKTLQKLKSNIENSKRITYGTLNETQKQIGAMVSNFADPVSVGNKGELRRLYATLAQDMDSTLKMVDQNAYDAVKAADKFYSDGVNLLNEKVIKSVTRKSPTDLFKYLSKPGREEELNLLQNVMGKETFNEFKGSILQKVFNDSVDTKGVISSKKLANNLKKYGDDSLKKFLSPDQYGRIKQLEAELASADNVFTALKSGTKPASGSQTGFLTQALGLGATVVTKPLMAVQLVLGNLGATKLFESGVGQDILTKGIDVSKDAINTVPNIIKDITKMGTKGANELLQINRPKQGSSINKPNNISAIERALNNDREFRLKDRRLA